MAHNNNLSDKTVLPRAKRNNSNTHCVSSSVMRRMPRYFRYLRNLLNNDVLRISSGDLAKLMNITPSQVRQDFNSFGDFGQQGYGYNVKYLYTQVSRILCVNKKFPAIIIGSGDMAKALLASTLFNIRGVRIVGVFSPNKDDVGKECSAFTVRHTDEIKEFCNTCDVSIAVYALPELYDGELCRNLSECGIKGLWNFSVCEISSEFIKCENLMMGDSLMLLMYEIGKEVREDGN